MHNSYKYIALFPQSHLYLEFLDNILETLKILQLISKRCIHKSNMFPDQRMMDFNLTSRSWVYLYITWRRCWPSLFAETSLESQKFWLLFEDFDVIDRDSLNSPKTSQPLEDYISEMKGYIDENWTALDLSRAFIDCGSLNCPKTFQAFEDCISKMKEYIDGVLDSIKCR